MGLGEGQKREGREKNGERDPRDDGEVAEKRAISSLLDGT